MAIFAEGLGFQTYSVPANTITQIFYGEGQGGTAITGSGTANVLRNPTVANTGTSTIYVGGGTVTTATGVPIGPGQQLVLITAPGTAASLVPSLFGITAASSATTISSGYASQTLVS
jgi:hypothetical protein